MKKTLWTAAALLAVTTLPLAAQQIQQRPPQPKPEVGGAAGALSGGNVGNSPSAISDAEWQYFREFMAGQTVPSARYDGTIVVGSALPGTVRYYEVENDPRFRNYRYTRLNDRYLLVDRDNRVIAIID